MNADDERDVVIVGCGAAGVSCALECVDVQLDTVVFEGSGRAGGQLAEIPHAIHNVAAGRFENGSALRSALEASAGILGARLRLSQSVTGVDVGSRWVEVDGTRVNFRALVLATGTSLRQLPAATEGGFGGDVTYQFEPRLEHFLGRDVVVIGGSDSAALDALELARAGSKVTLVHRSETLTARDDIIEHVRDEPRIDDLAGWELDSLRGGGRLEKVVLRHRDGRRLRLDAERLVVKIGRAPRTELVRGLVRLDRVGAIIVDQDLRTSQEAVMAAGDVVAGAYPRVATALGQGVLAARSVLRYLQGRR